jgi:hypothetical protein
MDTSQTRRRMNTPATNKIGDRTNFFDTSQRDITPTHMDQSIKDRTTITQRKRKPSSLITSRRESNLFETVQNLSKQDRQGASFNQLPQPWRRLFMKTPSTIGDPSLLTPSPGSVRPVRTYSPTRPFNVYSVLTPETN